MGNVGVQAERCDESPPLTFQDKDGLAATQIDERLPAARAFKAEMEGEERESEGVGHRGFECSGPARDRKSDTQSALGAFDSPGVENPACALLEFGGDGDSKGDATSMRSTNVSADWGDA